MVNMLRRKRYGEWQDSGKGIRVHKEVEHRAVWDCVFDRPTFETLQAALKADEQRAAQRGDPRKYLLVGYLTCGECSSRLGGTMKRDRPHEPNKPRYVCRPYNAYGERTGCAKVSRLAEPLDDFVTSALLYRLDSLDFAQVFTEAEDDAEALKAALDEHQAQKSKLDDLIDGYYGANPDGLTREQFMRAKAAAETTLQAAEKQIEAHSSKRAATGIPIGQTLRQAWNKNDDLGWRRQIIGLAIDKIIVRHGGGKPHYECSDGRVFKFDPDQVEIIWKV